MTTTNDAPAQAPSGSGVREAARAAVERLANVQMNISLEEWGALSSAILSALASDASPRGEAVAWAQTGYEAQLARYGAFPMRSEKDEALGYVEPLYAHPAPAPTPAEVIEGGRKAVQDLERDARERARDGMLRHTKTYSPAQLLSVIAAFTPASETEA